MHDVVEFQNIACLWTQVAHQSTELFLLQGSTSHVWQPVINPASISFPILIRRHRDVADYLEGTIAELLLESLSFSATRNRIRSVLCLDTGNPTSVQQAHRK
jgi:hypothetical protein